MKVKIDSIHFTADQKLLDLVEKKVVRVSKYYEGVIGADVFLKLENSGQVRDKVVEIKLYVPGNSLFVKSTDKTFERALDEASDNLKRQVIKHKELRRSH
jgi:putative sigma-54 modulation protein